MEMCTARGISNLPFIQQRDLAPKHIQSIHSKTRSHLITKQIGFNSGTGLRQYLNLSLRSATSEGTSTEMIPYDKDEPEPAGVIHVEDTCPDDNKDDYDTTPNRVLEEGSLLGNPMQWLKFLEEFDIKFDYGDTYSNLVFGAGGAVALWFAAAVVGAIDSIPLLPKALELIGLGYTVWFSSRYLILKENRDELFARVEQMKQEVLGPKEE